jgi:hypothetical protein
MDDHRTPDRADHPKPLRDERVANGVIAQYIHELADHDWVGSSGQTSGDARRSSM